VKISVEVDRVYPIVFSAYDLKLASLIMPVNHGAFLTCYDDAEGVYVMALSTSQPIPFCRRVEIKIIAPTAPIEEEAAIPLKYRISYTLAKVIDRDEFMRSLHEIFGLYSIPGREAAWIPGREAAWIPGGAAARDPDRGVAWDA